MANVLKIQRAYCVELKKTMSIDTARCEFFSLPENERKRFNFLCSDEICRFHNNDVGVRVTGVNYDKLCKEQIDGQRPIQGAHYRKNDEHHPECEWSINLRLEESLEQLDSESNDDFAQRKLHSKLNHFINVFDPDSDDEVASASDSEQRNQPRSNALGTSSGDKHHNHVKRNSPSKTKTSVLSRLVETWLEAKETLSEPEFKQLEVAIKGYGNTLLYRYFKPVKYFENRAEANVVYGGATLTSRYGLGFKLRFFDRINDQAVYLYCSKEQMENYRFRRYIDAILDSDCRYFKVYFLKQNVVVKDGYITCEVSSLKNIHIVPVMDESKKK
ncbi:hypothetical protein [Vibrio vulnificus]|uniref:hypothetical protein n=1 Tax=Vibrio vulnificus TaxID=672 RepID=UPI000A979409|nr:hypothetical protein [Vibrio vulnificus]MCU8386771.1 hypothetical protein [Vibrio vulnificus]